MYRVDLRDGLKIERRARSGDRFGFYFVVNVGANVGCFTASRIAHGRPYWSLDRHRARRPRVRAAQAEHRAQRRTLASVMREAAIDRCDYMKIDCEGGEYEILASLPAQLAERIEQVSIEATACRGTA